MRRRDQEAQRLAKTFLEKRLSVEHIDNVVFICDAQHFIDWHKAQDGEQVELKEMTGSPDEGLTGPARIDVSKMHVFLNFLSNYHFSDPVINTSDRKKLMQVCPDEYHEQTAFGPFNFIIDDHMNMATKSMDLVHHKFIAACEELAEDGKKINPKLLELEKKVLLEMREEELEQSANSADKANSPTIFEDLQEQTLERFIAGYTYLNVDIPDFLDDNAKSLLRKYKELVNNIKDPETSEDLKPALRTKAKDVRFEFENDYGDLFAENRPITADKVKMRHEASKHYASSHEEMAGGIMDAIIFIDELQKIQGLQQNRGHGRSK